jgi:hypothetical protein
MKAHLTTHAILDTIPLRVGAVLSDRKVLLENLIYDEIGTDQQNRRELNDKRYHVIANLVTLYPTRRDLGRWRLVIKDSPDPQKFPPVFTVLPTEADIRTEANLTKAISDARQSGDSRITPEYIRDVLYPLYKTGQLRNQQDLSDLLNKGQVEGLVSALEEANETHKALLARISELEAKEAVQDQEMSKINYENQVIDVTDRAILEHAEIVTIQRQKGPTQYTEIRLSNGLKLLKKWDIPRTLAKATALKGKYVRTTVWNKIGSKPTDRDYWKPTEWFEDIYEIKDAATEESK